MYAVNDRIVHPMHGAGVVDEIVERTIDGQTESYYALRLALERVILYIPVKSCDSLGIRPVCTADQAHALLDKLPAVEADPAAGWTRRYRENMTHLRSGDLLEVAGVVKGLTLRDRGRGLSAGEKKMLSLARQILVSELALSLNVDADSMKQEVLDRLCPREKPRRTPS